MPIIVSVLQKSDSMDTQHARSFAAFLVDRNEITRRAGQLRAHRLFGFLRRLPPDRH